MLIHVLYEESGRILSASVVEKEENPRAVRMRPVPADGEFAATFKISDDLVPLSPADFVNGARVERTEGTPRLLYGEDPKGGGSALVGREIGSPRRSVPARTECPGAALASNGGPFATALLPIDLLLSRVAVRNPALASFGAALRDVALAAASSVYVEAIPALAGAAAKTFGLPAAGALRLELALAGELPLVPLGPPAVEPVEQSFRALASRGGLDPERVTESFLKGVRAAFAEEQEEQEEEDGPGSGEEIDNPPDLVWVKVGSLERHDHVPPVHQTAPTGGSPLYCHEVAGNDRKDEPKGAELAYVGDLREDSLRAPNDSVEARFDVAGRWNADLDHDRPDGYWTQVPLGVSTHFYHWFLCQPGLIDEAWFEKGVAEVQKTLKDKQKEINDKVKDFAKSALSGTIAAPAAPLAGMLAGELTKYVTDYLVELLTAKRFDPVTLVHLTVQATAQDAPLSIVMLTANGAPRQLWRNEGTETRPNFTQRYRNPDLDTVSRSWAGASTPPGSAPRIKAEVAQANKVVVWRRSAEGFGALVPQRQGKGSYVSLVRADVRQVPASDLPEPV